MGRDSWPNALGVTVRAMKKKTMETESKLTTKQTELLKLAPVAFMYVPQGDHAGLTYYAGQEAAAHEAARLCGSTVVTYWRE